MPCSDSGYTKGITYLIFEGIYFPNLIILVRHYFNSESILRSKADPFFLLISFPAVCAQQTLGMLEYATHFLVIRTVEHTR